MRVVLDTNILIRANPKGRGPARELLQKIISGDHVLITSDFLLQEVARVLAYPRIEERWRLHSREVEQYLQVLASLSELVKPHPGISIVSKDIDDDPIVYTAVTGKADVLCTLDAHFYEDSVKSFCAQKSIAIMDDAELLRVMRSREEKKTR
jgi:putative PIN family toxin of toxin-antitoxin system